MYHWKISRWDEFNDMKGHKQWTEWVIQVVQRCQGSHVFSQLVWPTPVTIGDLSWCCLIRPVEIFPTVLVVSSLRFWCVSKIFFFLSFLFFFYLSPLSLNAVFFSFTIWKSRRWHSRLANRRCHLQLFKLCYFSKYFVHHVILSIFLLYESPKILYFLEYFVL
jgi:hypothetical protein